MFNWLTNLYDNFFVSGNVDTNVSDGVYRITVHEVIPGAAALFPTLNAGQSFMKNGKQIVIQDFMKGDGSIQIKFSLHTDGTMKAEDANFWAAGILVVLGLAALAFTVTKIEKLVPKETINLVLITISVAVLFFVWKHRK